MSKPRAKTIKLLLNDGTLNGVISIADSFWNSGKLYSSPRDSIDELRELEICKNYGVYLLLSENKVYIGQASDLSQRIKQHIIGKTWWDRVVLLTTDNDSLDKSDIDYLEASLIDKAIKFGSLDSDNKQKGNKKKVNEFREVELEQYLEEALFLLELIGITVFCESRKSKISRKSFGIDTGVTYLSGRDQEIRAKREAIEFLKDKGITISKNANYAKRGDDKAVFWINPKITSVNADWDIILNNQVESKLILMHIPAKTLSLATKGKAGLHVRTDQKQAIEIKIDSNSYIDKVSKISFKPYITQIISY